jgi:hypothetical protein
MKNKGLSDIIATILLVLITIVAVSVVAVVVIKFVKEAPEEAKCCFDMIDKISIADDYTCYTGSSTSVMIKRSFDNEMEIKKLIFTLINEGEAKTYEIYYNKPTEGIKLYNGSDLLTIPNPGGGLTYNFTGFSARFIRVGAAVCVKSVCEIVKDEKIEAC